MNSMFYAPDGAALILEGGAMRGVFEAGVLDAFLEKGLRFLKVIGTSAGAMQAICYLSEQKGRNIRINAKYCNDKRYMGFRHLLKKRNYFNFDFMFGQLTYKLDPIDIEALKNTKSDLRVVVTNCLNGQAEYISNKDYPVDEYMNVIKASASIPLLSPPVNIGDVLYADGGVAMPLVPLPEELPFPTAKPVYILTRDASYRKKEIPGICKPFIGFMAGNKYPAVLSALYRVPSVYNQKMEMLLRLEEKGEIFVIRPQGPVSVKRAETDSDKLLQLHNEGYRIGMERFDELMGWLYE